MTITLPVPPYNFTFKNVFYNPASPPIGIQKIGKEVPENYNLSQNYPNPFNPSSKIKFQIAEQGNVQLLVYDILGRNVATLVNEKMQPGVYEADFDGSKFSSGVYFYKLIANNFNGTKKMELVK